MRPTENPGKVAAAITNLFPGNISNSMTDQDRMVIRVEGEGLTSLDRFRMILSRDRIRAAARAILHRQIENNRIITFLNKQVAHAGHVSFCDPVGESPLGPIRVEIQSDDPTAVINWLTGEEPRRRPK